MTPEQARAMHLACDFLHSYVSRGGQGLLPSDEQLVQLTDGNFLASDALAGMLAKLFGKTFDQVLDELTEWDEGYPPAPAATPRWDTTIDQLKYVHANDWTVRPEPSSAYDLPTAFRSSFNLVVALNNALAKATQDTPRLVARLLRDAAAAEM